MVEGEIRKLFALNNVCTTLTIPKKLARKYGLDKGSYVIIEDTPKGILIKKAKIS
jgi:hypothetical protein